MFKMCNAENKILKVSFYQSESKKKIYSITMTISHRVCMNIQLSPGNSENLLKFILLACLKFPCVARKKKNHLLFLVAKSMSSCKPLISETASFYLGLQL